jgi:hypothetical protein
LDFGSSMRLAFARYGSILPVSTTTTSGQNQLFAK